MNTRRTIPAVGMATGLFIAISFTLCVIFDLLFPNLAMYTAWQKLLPGFTWLSFKSYLIGLAWSLAYGWYFALVWVPLLRLFSRTQHADATS